MDHFHRSIWSEIFRTIFDHLSGDKNPGKFFVLNADPWIRFIVLQINIVTWLMLFDETIFQKQGIHFSSNNECFDVGYQGWLGQP